MENDQSLMDAQKSLQKDFELEGSEGGEFVLHLADKIAYMLEHETELLFSYFYRLDINEMEIQRILSYPGPIPTNIALAELVLARQVARARTKRDYKQANADWMKGWDERD